MLDAHTLFETPEGIRIRLDVAGPLPRALAWLIDLGIRGMIYGVCGLLLSHFGNFGYGIMLIIVFLSEWLYPTVFEAMKGATPGKMAMDLYVIMDDGTSLTWSASFARNLLRAVDFLPFFYVLGFFFTLTNDQFKRIGDLMASTVVVYNHEEPDRSASEDKTAEARSLPLALTAEEQRLIMLYADHSSKLSESRQREIANILAPLLQEQDDEAVRILRQYAAWIKGAQG